MVYLFVLDFFSQYYIENILKLKIILFLGPSLAWAYFVSSNLILKRKEFNSEIRDQFQFDFDQL